MGTPTPEGAATTVSDVNEADWVARFADEVIAEAARHKPGRPIVCASGLSPSGPIHLGNQRELMTPHLVADEIKSRGIDCVHVLSFDDYDRFRKVPKLDPELPAEWADHIGKPLTTVPAPPGSSHANWAEHFKAPLLASMARLGIEVRAISQTEMYTSGAYTDEILRAMAARHEIDAILDKYRTKGRPAVKANQKLSEDEAAAALEAAEGSGAADEDDGATGGDYYPYKPYCSVCDRDTTTVTAYDDDTTELTYTCACGHGETVILRDHRRGKLVWKVDWPMRWAYEGVDFEPSGVDHSSPGSSFMVGGEIVGPIFDGVQPIGPMYAFVGIAGMSKMSSSRGGVPTAADALEIMEPQLLRWLYARRRPNQSFQIAFGQENQRLYDEWDALVTRVATGAASPFEVATYGRAALPALPTTEKPLPFGTLASIVDVTTGDEQQTLRIVRDLDPSQPVTSLAEVRPRLDCAQHWITTQVPADQRTLVRSAPDSALLASLDDEQRASLAMLVDGLDENWSLSGLTGLVYGVPKRRLGLPLDVKPTPELRTAQRSFFALLYQLLVGRDTGPRLPTLLLAVGADRVRALLAA
jgi:lysyl-tRNA synthetase, class I